MQVSSLQFSQAAKLNALSQATPVLFSANQDDDHNSMPPSEQSAQNKKPHFLHTLAIAGLSALHSLSDEATKTILESNFLFMPQPAINLGEWDKQFGLQFKTKSGLAIHAVHVPAKPGKPTVVFSNGNASNMAQLINMAQQAQWQQKGIGFLFYDYPGYGKSEGKTNESTIYEAINGALAYLKQNNVPNREVVLAGWSLGSAVTAQAASTHRVKGVILTSPFKNISGMIHALRKNAGVPDWWFPPQEKANEPFDNLNKAPKIEAPLLVMHGETDILIPVGHGKAIFDAAASKDKQFKVYPDVGHNDIVANSRFITDVNDFLVRLSSQNH